MGVTGCVLKMSSAACRHRPDATGLANGGVASKKISYLPVFPSAVFNASMHLHLCLSLKEFRERQRIPAGGGRGHRRCAQPEAEWIQDCLVFVALPPPPILKVWHQWRFPKMMVEPVVTLH